MARRGIFGAGPAGRGMPGRRGADHRERRGGAARRRQGATIVGEVPVGRLGERRQGGCCRSTGADAAAAPAHDHQGRARRDDRRRSRRRARRAARRSALIGLAEASDGGRHAGQAARRGRARSRRCRRASAATMRPVQARRRARAAPGASSGARHRQAAALIEDATASGWRGATGA